MTNTILLRSILILSALLVVAGCGERPVAQSSPPAVELRELVGAVAMPDRFGAQAAAAVLKQGGNAVDAAIAAAFVLAVTYPEAGNIGGGGFLLNNEMDDFSVKPGVPNFYGVVGSNANAIEPGKRPLSSMSPTLLLQDGQVRMALGSPGGSTIFGSVFLTIAAIVDAGLTPDDAVALPRFHHQLLPPELITYTPSVPLAGPVVAELDGMGYRVEPHAWEFGDLQVVWFDGSDWQAASDPRHRGESRVVMRAVNPALSLVSIRRRLSNVNGARGSGGSMSGAVAPAQGQGLAVGKGLSHASKRHHRRSVASRSPSAASGGGRR